MKIKYLIIVVAFLVLALSACSSATTQTPEVNEPVATVCPPEKTCPTCPDCPVPPTPIVQNVPNQDAWANSPHNAADAEAFNHWNADDPAEIPTSCARCHSTQGYQDFLGADGSEAGKVDAAVPAPAGTLQCETCHNPAAEALTAVTFPSGVTVEGLGGEARCMVCHQGRAAGATISTQIEKFNATDPDAVVAPIKEGDQETKFGFINIHYYAAATTLYGGQAQGGFQFEDKTYDWKNDHTAGFDTCIGCHDQHSLQVKVDQCANCHEGVDSVEKLKDVRMVSSSSDYDGDGDTTEGMFYEIQGLQEALYANLQAYAKEVTGTGIVYDAETYPYYLADADGDGKGDTGDNGAVSFSTWTPNLLEAAYNYQLSMKDPGAFAHGNKYIVQLLYDSTEALNSKLASPMDMSKMTRDDAGHFAGNSAPFRDWDDTGVVPYSCAKCHSAQGLPSFIANGGTVVVDSRGTTRIVGIGSMLTSNGFACSTCHDDANFPNRYAVASVVFPSGKTVSYGGKDDKGAFVADDANICITCHQGRESTTSVTNYLKGKEEDTPDPSISFKNIHYLPAGATLFGNEAAGAYQYTDKEYAGLNPHPINKCTDCHDVHALEPKTENCAQCHGEKPVEDFRMPKTPDYDGDGDVTEGVKAEIDTLEAALFSQIQTYAETKAGVPILYDPNTYPYFFVDADKDGTPDKNDKGANINYNAWTPRLLKAAYNYQYSQKEPGAFVHNPVYVVQFLFDSIADMGGDVSTYTRP
jgi:hypothetical protein